MRTAIPNRHSATQLSGRLAAYTGLRSGSRSVVGKKAPPSSTSAGACTSTGSTSSTFVAPASTSCTLSTTPSSSPSTLPSSTTSCKTTTDATTTTSTSSPSTGACTSTGATTTDATTTTSTSSTSSPSTSTSLRPSTCDEADNNWIEPDYDRRMLDPDMKVFELDSGENLGRYLYVHNVRDKMNGSRERVPVCTIRSGRSGRSLLHFRKEELLALCALIPIKGFRITFPTTILGPFPSRDEARDYVLKNVKIL
ncbi:unnamed protein product [Amoebophrya sp. A25]|nr:unnamed protein product [Amoebophrya sp. A25]|eukprot:GSA25T00023286001.1